MTMLLAGSSVNLDATGNGRVSIAPNTARDTWEIGRVTVQSGSAVNPTVRLYRNEVDTSAFIDGTVNARANVADYAPPLTLTPGDRLWVVWTGGSPGAQATVQVFGDRRTVR